jgi:hypothetical protein
MLWKYKKCYAETNEGAVSSCVSDCYTIDSVKLIASPENPSGVTYRHKRCSDNSVYIRDISIGETIYLKACVKMDNIKISGNDGIGSGFPCFTQEEIDNALSTDGVLFATVTDFTQNPNILVGALEFKIVSACS